MRILRSPKSVFSVLGLYFCMCTLPPGPELIPTDPNIEIAIESPDSTFFIGDSLKLNVRIAYPDSFSAIRVFGDSILDTLIAPVIDTHFTVSGLLTGTGTKKVTCIAFLRNSTKRDTSFHIRIEQRNSAPNFVTEPFTIIVGRGGTGESGFPILARDAVDMDSVILFIDTTKWVVPRGSHAELDSVNVLRVSVPINAANGSGYSIPIVAEDTKGGRDTLLVSVAVVVLSADIDSIILCYFSRIQGGNYLL